MKFKKITVILTLAIALVSCEGFVTEIDEQDPNRATDADLRLVMAGMTLEFGGTMQGEMARLAGMWSGHFSGDDRQYISLANYNTNAGDYDSPWGNAYAFVFKQSRICQEKATAVNNLVSLGIAQVVEAHIMGTSAALWGDIPYRQAVNQVEFPNPVYDPQIQVFNDLLVLLDDAIENLGTGTGAGTGDILLAGNAASWTRVANTLKARYHFYKKEYNLALTAAKNGIMANSQNLFITHGTTNNQNRNLYFDFIIRQRAGYMGGTNVHLKAVMNGRNHAKTNETSRLANYYIGGTGGPNTNTGGFFATNASFQILTAIDNLLMIAECEARLNGVTAGVTALNAARAQISAANPSGTYSAFVDSDFDAGGIENPTNLTPANALLAEILQERYVSLYGQIEVFNEVRRTNNAIGLSPITGSQLPQRFLYAQNEVNANTNVPDPIPSLFTKTAIFQ